LAPPDALTTRKEERLRERNGWLADGRGVEPIQMAAKR